MKTGERRGHRLSQPCFQADASPSRRYSCILCSVKRNGSPLLDSPAKNLPGSTVPYPWGSSTSFGASQCRSCSSPIPCPEAIVPQGPHDGRSRSHRMAAIAWRREVVESLRQNVLGGFGIWVRQTRSERAHSYFDSSAVRTAVWKKESGAQACPRICMVQMTASSTAAPVPPLVLGLFPGWRLLFSTLGVDQRQIILSVKRVPTNGLLSRGA